MNNVNTCILTVISGKSPGRVKKVTGILKFAQSPFFSTCKDPIPLRDSISLSNSVAFKETFKPETQ